jgi:hypothetical protein
VAVLTAVGMIVSARREDVVSWWFFLTSTGLLLLWPFHPGRYLAPLIPLLVLFLFRGMRTAEHWFDSIVGEFSLGDLVVKIACVQPCSSSCTMEFGYRAIF